MRQRRRLVFPLLSTRHLPRESQLVVLIAALGWTAAAVGAVVALPQVLRLLRSGSAAGISLLAWQITLSANVAWTVHGVVDGHPNIWAPNVVFGVYSVLVLVRLRQLRRIGWVPLLGPSLVVGALTVGLDQTAGPLAFSIAVFLPSALAQVAQLQALIISTNITGVSMPFLVMNVINQILWVTWSLFSGETSVTMVGSALGTLMTLNLVVGLLRRSGALRARLAQMHA